MDDLVLCPILSTIDRVIPERELEGQDWPSMAWFCALFVSPLMIGLFERERIGENQRWDSFSSVSPPRQALTSLQVAPPKRAHASKYIESIHRKDTLTNKNRYLHICCWTHLELFEVHRSENKRLKTKCCQTDKDVWGRCTAYTPSCKTSCATQCATDMLDMCFVQFCPPFWDTIGLEQRSMGAFETIGALEFLSMFCLVLFCWMSCVGCMGS